MAITEEVVEKAVDWLRDTAEEGAQFRANRIYLEAYCKTVLAEEMKRFSDIPISAQEREARCSDRYRETLEAYKAAVKADEEYRFLREARSARIEAWRSQEATRRAEGKAYQ